MTTWIADTSVAVPLVHSAHADHDQVMAIMADRPISLAAHSAVETYSVLTRLPGDARLAPSDVVALLDERFGAVVTIDEPTQRGIVARLAAASIAGGAVYDALIAITAHHHDAVLLTRDTRAAATYRAIGATYELVV